jgi:hypothetical protein
MDRVLLLSLRFRAKPTERKARSRVRAFRLWEPHRGWRYAVMFWVSLGFIEGKIGTMTAVVSLIVRHNKEPRGRNLLRKGFFNRLRCLWNLVYRSTKRPRPRADVTFLALVRLSV